MAQSLTTLISYQPPAKMRGFLLLLLLQLSATVLGTREPLRLTPNLPELRFASGGRAVLNCLANRVTPGSFSWSGPAITNRRASVQSSASGIVSELTIDDFRQGDAGQYSCSFTGLGTVSTTLSVVSTPGFLDVPLRQVFVEGSDAVVECPAFFGSPPTATMLWHNGTTFINTGGRFTAENGWLRIQNIRMEDGQVTYKCFLHHGANPFKPIQVVVVPQSDFAPRIDDTNRRIEVTYGEPLNLPCQLEEPKDDVSYSWTINTEFERNHEVNTRANLHREAHEFLSGIYTCKAENEYGYDVVDFIVKIIAPPLPSMCSLVRKTTAVGTTVVLKYCDLTTPVELSDLEFEWKRLTDNGEIVDVQLGERVSVNHNGWLTIKNIQQSDLGVYKVNISNEMGSAVHTVHLELAGRTTTPPPTPQTGSRAHSRFHLATLPLNLKVQIDSEGVTCSDIKEEVKSFIQRHLIGKYDFAGVSIERATIECSSNSEFGIFKASLQGRNAKQLIAQIQRSGASHLTLENGQTLTLQACTKECVLEDSVTPRSLSKIGGGIIAATFIFVVLAGLILLLVILVRYRRRSLTKCTDKEQVLPLYSTGTTLPRYQTNPDNSFDLKSTSKKPIYGRSISLTTFPLTR